MPNLVQVNHPLAETLKHWHMWLAYSLAALVVLHILAALKHQFIDKHPLLHRMGIGRGPKI